MPAAIVQRPDARPDFRKHHLRDDKRFAIQVVEALGNIPRRFAVIGISGRSFAIGDAPVAPRLVQRQRDGPQQPPSGVEREARAQALAAELARQRAGSALARFLNLPNDVCQRVIEQQLLASYGAEANPKTGFPVFAFRLHQFISRLEKRLESKIQTGGVQ